MPKPQDRTVYMTPEGWTNKRNGAERAEGIYPTQREAAKVARQNLQNSGGGELTIQGANGRFRDKDTIARIAPIRNFFPDHPSRIVPTLVALRSTRRYSPGSSWGGNWTTMRLGFTRA